MLSGDKISDINELTKSFDDGSIIYDEIKRKNIRNLMFLSLGHSNPLSTLLQKESDTTGQESTTSVVDAFKNSENQVTENLKQPQASPAL